VFKKTAVFLAALCLGGPTWGAEPAAMSHDEMVTGYYLAQAQEGSAYAQLALGEMYYDGDVVQRDLVKAFAWLSVSAHQDVSEAADLLAKLEQEITPEERTRAEALAREFIENHVAPAP
jgi:TPR repeat protein